MIGCLSCPRLLLRGRALAGLATVAASEANLLCEGRALCRVIWRDHRVIGREAPFNPVIVGSHAVGRTKMPFQHLQLLAVFQADQVFGSDRLADRNGRLERLMLGV